MIRHSVTRRLVPLLTAGLVLVGVLTGRPDAGKASGVSLPEAVLVSRAGRAHDELPAFAAPRLGVVLPSFDRRRLFIAYRRLLGRPLTERAMKALAEPCCELNANLPDAIALWVEARATVPGAPVLMAKDIDPYRHVDAYSWVLNCNADAFRTAAATLKTRLAADGVALPAVRDWLDGQDTVFKACWDDTASLPADTAPDAPAWLRADRAYQQAATLFYQRRYAEAGARFTTIAADTASPWRGTAAYLVARAAARVVVDLKGQTAAAAAYRTAADHVLADPALASWHPEIRRLDGVVAYRSDPAGRARALEAALLAAGEDAAPVTDLDDLVTLVAANPQGADFARWIAAIRRPDAASRAEALRRWNAGGGMPWLMAALMPGENGDAPPEAAADPSIDAAADAAATVPPDEPAYATVTWHRIERLIARGEADAARRALEPVLALTDLDTGSRNLFRAQALALSRTLEEFAAYAPRRALYIRYESDEWIDEYWANGKLSPIEDNPSWQPNDILTWREEMRGPPTPSYLADDAAAVANASLPAKRLAALAGITTLPAHIRRSLALTAWTRAALLGDAATARAVAGAVKAGVPALAADLDDFAAAGAGRRRFLAAYILLKLPGASPQLQPGLGYHYPPDLIGDFGPRWWEGATYGQPVQSCILRCRDARPAARPAPPFVTAADTAAAEAEAKQLNRFNDVAGALGTAVLDWAKSHPKDPRVPEALHLTVRATKYVHSPTPVSKQAFTLLHRRYGNTEWAKKTQYWY